MVSMEVVENGGERSGVKLVEMSNANQGGAYL